MATGSSDPSRVFQQLDGSNFGTWKFRMRMLLEDKDLWEIVIKEEPRPASTDRALLTYTKRERKAYVLITQMVADSQLQFIQDCKTGSEAWEKLLGVYESKGRANRLVLKEEFEKLKKVPTESMQAWFSRVEAAAQKLKDCGASCDSDDVFLKILGGLPKQFDPLVMVLEALPDLSMDDMKARLVHEELRRPTAEAGAEDSALVSHHGNSGGSAGGGRTSGAEHKKGAKKFKCYYCGKVGHKKSECWKRKKDLEKRQNGSGSTPAAQASTASDNVFVTGVGSLGAENWYLDSGATKHMTRVKSWFSDFKESSACPVFVGNGMALQCVGTGSISCAMLVDGNSVSGKLADVWYVPGLTTNLLSVSCLTAKGWTVDFGKQGCSIKSAAGAVVARAVKEDNMYRVLMTTASTSAAAQVAAAADSAQLWHERLGHVGAARLKLLQHKGLVSGLPMLGGAVDRPCISCLKGKQQRKKFPKQSFTRAKEVLGLVHSDIATPSLSVPSLGGARYYIIFVDDLSRHTAVYFMTTRDEALSKFKEFKAVAEKQTGKQLKMLRTDGAGEYTSAAFKGYLAECGIQTQLATAYSPQQNGVAERCIKTVSEMMRCMLHEKQVEPGLWAEAVSTSVYIKNRLPTKAVPDKTPEEVWTGRKPSVVHMKVFGCAAHVHVPSVKRSKLDARSEQCIFVGYCSERKAYRLFNPGTRKIVFSRDVEFDESSAPCPPAQETDGPTVAVLLEEEEEEEGESEEADSDAEEEEAACGDFDEPVADPVSVRRSTRIRRLPTEWWKTTSTENAAYAFIGVEPSSFEEAAGAADGKLWKAAMDSEMNSQLENKSWTLTQLPSGRKAIGCKWVFKIKRKADGSLERYKARLVAKGYSQVQGEDFTETFAPVVKFASVRLILSIAAIKDMHVHHMDVTCAFLNGELKEEIYMEQAPGYIKPGEENLVCKLNRSIYGLKQAPRSWYEKLHQKLVELGFWRSSADHSVYVLSEADVRVYVMVYVDDMLIVSNTLPALENFKHQMQQQFKMTDLGEAEFFLGLLLKRNMAEHQIELNQQRYITEVLQRFNMQDSKPKGTPVAVGAHLVASTEPENAARSRYYRSAVGSLMYVMVATRPDLAYAVGALSQFMANPSEEHVIAAKRVLRYLKGTVGCGLLLGAGGEECLSAYSDADHAGDVNNRKSVSGYAVLYGNGAVIWSSKKQNCVSISSTEAEYVAASEATMDLAWVRQLLADLHKAPGGPTKLYVDNESAVKLAVNPVFHARTKHIDVRYHFIRDMVEKKQVEPARVDTKDNIADSLTKPVPKAKFDMCAEGMGLVV